MDIKLVGQNSNNPKLRFLRGGKPLRCLPHDKLNFKDLKIRSTKPSPSEFGNKNIGRVIAVSKVKAEERYIPLCEIKEFSNGKQTKDFSASEISNALKGELEIEADDEECNVSLSNLEFVPGSELRISRDLIPSLTEDVNPDDIDEIKESSGRYLFLAGFSGESELWPLFAFDRLEGLPSKLCSVTYNYLVQMGKAQKPNLRAIKSESFNAEDCYDLVKAAMGSRSSSQAEEDFIAQSDVAFELGFNEYIRAFVLDHIDDIKPWLQSPKHNNNFWIALMTYDVIRDFCKPPEEVSPRRSREPKPEKQTVVKVEPDIKENLRFLQLLNAIELNPAALKDDNEANSQALEFLKTVPIQEYSARKRVYNLILKNPDEICSYALAANRSLIESDDPAKTRTIITKLTNLGKRLPDSFAAQGAGDNEAIISGINIRELRDWVMLGKNKETLFGENLLKQFKKLGISFESQDESDLDEAKPISTRRLHEQFRAAHEPVIVENAPVIIHQPRFSGEDPKLAEIFLKIEANRDELTSDEKEFLSKVHIKSQNTREYVIDLLEEYSRFIEKEFNFYLAMNPSVIEGEDEFETIRNRDRLTICIFNTPNSKAALGGAKNSALISNDENREFLNDWFFGVSAGDTYPHANTDFAMAIVDHPVFLSCNEDGSSRIRDTICEWSRKNKNTVLGRAVLKKIDKPPEPPKSAEAAGDQATTPLPRFPIRADELRIIMRARGINKILSRGEKNLEDCLCNMVRINAEKQLQDVIHKLTYYDTLEEDESTDTKRHDFLNRRKEALEHMLTLNGQELLVERIIDRLSRGKNLNHNFLKWLSFSEIKLSPEMRAKLTKTIIQLTKEPNTRHKTAIFYLCRKPGFLYEGEEKAKLLRLAKRNKTSALAMGLRRNPDLGEKELASIALEPKLVNKKFNPAIRAKSHELLEYIVNKRRKISGINDSHVEQATAVIPTTPPESKTTDPVIKLGKELRAGLELTQPKYFQPANLSVTSVEAKALLEFFIAKTPLPFDREQISSFVFDESDIPALIDAARMKYKKEAFLLAQNESVKSYIQTHQNDYTYLEADRNEGRQFGKGYYTKKIKTLN